MSKVRQVVLDMLKVRKYKIPESEVDINGFMEAEEYLTHKIYDESEKIYIFFPTMPKVGVTTIRQYIQEMEENNVPQSIIVVKETITAFAKQVFVEAKPLIIDYFKESELQMNILNHVLVPKHEILSDEQKEELLKMYKCKEVQLQKMLSSDPVARFFGARRGQVFKITRTSETSGSYENYRVVV